MDKVFIRGLRISCIVGILPHERELEQDLQADIVMELDLKKAALTGDLNESVDYARVCREVTDFIKHRQARLLESLAYEVCAFILKNFKLQKVTVALTKLQAVPGTQGVGVEAAMTAGELND